MRYLLAIGLVLSLTASGSAYHCTTYSTSSADVTADASATTLYLVGVCGLVGFVTNHALGCGDTLTLVYEESNGIPGLQRRDEIVDDTCHDMFPGDRILF